MLIFFLTVQHSGATPLVNRIVAVVNGQSITLLELEARLKLLLGLFEDIRIEDLPESQLKQTKAQVLQQMVNDILLRQEADRFGIEVSDREIENHIRQVRQENDMDEEQFLEHLRSQGLTKEAYKKQTRDSILRQRVLTMMVRRKVVVTREEIEDFYHRNTSSFLEEKRVHLKVILVADFDKAVQVRELIKDGEINFDQAAADFSQGPSPDRGGDLGFVHWERLAPEWRQALDGLEEGDISQPFVVRGSGALLNVVEIQAGGAVPLTEVEDEIRREIFDAKLDQRFEEYIQGLRERAVIDVRL